MAARFGQKEAGFTLIEAIVALVILGAVLVVFFEFLSSSLHGAQRIQAASTAYDRHQNAIEIATAINPMSLPQGTLDLDGYRISWKSDLIGNIRQSSRYPLGPGIFKVALYRMTFSFPDNKDVQPISVTRLGFQRDNVTNPFSVEGTGQISGGTR